ncbi:MAG: hypothetical protein ACFBRM_16170 [Pikeienuella sp.]
MAESGDDTKASSYHQHLTLAMGAVTGANALLQGPLPWLSGAAAVVIGIYWVVRLQLDSDLGVERLRALLGDKGLRRRGVAVLYGLADLAAALVLFTGLGVALIAAVSALNWLAGQPLLDLGALFDDLKRPEGWIENLWLIAMIFSTFLPTAAHAAIACLSLVSAVPVPWGDYVRRGLHEHAEGRTDRTRRFAITAQVTVMILLSLALPVVILGGLGYGLWRWHPEVFTGYLGLFEATAAALAP